MNAPLNAPFETALNARVDAMIDACTRCGKCVEACPVTDPAEIDAAPETVITGVLDLLRTGDGPEVSRRWASSCVLSGECIKACDEGVNPRFLLAMARAAMAKTRHEPKLRRKQGVEDFRKLAQDVGVLSKMQLTSEMLARLGQDAGADRRHDEATSERPDFVFYTGCNVLKTPHIALLALDVMDALGVTYTVMGGPSHCCGVVQFRTGDVEASGRMAEHTLDRLAQGKSGQVVSWCASCHVQFTEFTLPAHERMTGSRAFEMTPFMLFLRSRLDQLRPLLRHRVEARVALHRHPGVPGVMEAAADILAAVPGIEVVELDQPAVGLMSNSLRALPDYKRKLQRDELEAARGGRRRRIGRGLSSRPPRALRARARLPVRHHQSARRRRRQHGLEPGRSIQAAEEAAGRRTDHGGSRGPARRQPGERGPCTRSIETMLAEQPLALRKNERPAQPPV